jgi:twitching motility protein PilU
VISKEDALRYADSSNDVRLKIKMHEQGKYGTDDSLGLSVDEPEEEGIFLGRTPGR